MTRLHAVIMAGGSGTRFWPLSRRLRPKQVLPLLHGRALIAATLDRLVGVQPAPRTWVCCAQHLEAPIRTVLSAEAPTFLIEPEPRDTAPCIALSCARILAETEDPECVLAFLPADHAIEPAERFREILAAAVQRAGAVPSIVVLGIRPDHPATGYGYIEQGEPRAELMGTAMHEVRSFREKPGPAEAAAWLEQGGFSWNGGFVFVRIATLLAELAAHAPLFAQGIEDMRAAFATGDASAARAAFCTLPRISFDYALLEKSSAVEVAIADFAWDDLGSFRALPAHTPRDAHGNAVLAAEGLETLLEDCSSNIIAGHGDHLIALLGVEDLVVVHTEDATLICAKDRAEEIKGLVAELERRGREDLL